MFTVVRLPVCAMLVLYRNDGMAIVKLLSPSEEMRLLFISCDG